MSIRRLFGPEPKYPMAALHHPKPSPELRMIAGPCSVEGEEFIHSLVQHLKAAGATMIRGGCYRYGTYPPDKSGLDKNRLRWLADAAFENDMPFITEIMDHRDILNSDPATWLQVGARHAQHYPLLKEIGYCRKPVMLKRGTNMTLDETLGSAEYLLKSGASKVAVCERGIVSFEDHCRWTLSIGAIAALKEYTGLQVVGDPSHGSGDRAVVPRLGLACLVAGADGIMVEVHPKPDESISDAEQAISIETFRELVKNASRIAHAASGL